MKNRSIPNTFIKNLLSITNIVDLVSSRVELKKKGKNYYAYCPFHNEKTPSFTVSIEKQFFYCFGCNTYGNAIDFLMKYENIDFVNCIKEIAFINGLEIPNNKVLLKNKNLYHVMELLNNIYTQSLLQTNYLSKRAYNYLNKRGINSSTIKKFSIGYAISNWLEELNKNKNLVSIKQSLYDVGVLIKNKDYNIDLFRDRIIFPIRNIYGKIVGFGGRITSNKKPKYINSPETKIFNKSANIYGLYEVCKKYKKISCLLLVEGYMDVLSLSQFGIKYVVSSLGTVVTIKHIKMLFLYTNNIVCCYDGDKAGMQAAWNTLKIALPYMYDGKQLSFIFLPKGEDPDSIIRKEGKDNFEKRIKKCVSFSEFLFSSIISRINISTYNGLVKLSKLACPLINKIPGNIIRMYMRRELGKKIGILDDNKLALFLSEKKFTISSHLYFKRTNMRTLIGLLIQNTNLVNIAYPFIKFLEKIKIAGMSIFIELINQCISNSNITTGQLIELHRGKPYDLYIKRLAFWDHMIIDKEIENVFKDTLFNVYNLSLKTRQDELIAWEKYRGLTLKERHEFWSINLLLMKNK